MDFVVAAFADRNNIAPDILLFPSTIYFFYMVYIIVLFTTVDAFLIMVLDTGVYNSFPAAFFPIFVVLFFPIFHFIHLYTY